MIIGRKGIKNECCDKESYIIQLINSLRDKVTNCINKINGISPDGDNNFNILPGEGISINQENNGIVINALEDGDVSSLNGKTGNVILESNDSAIEVTDNGNSTIGVNMADWIFDDMGEMTTNINDNHQAIEELRGAMIRSVDGITPDGTGDLKVVGDDGIVVNSGSDNKLYVGIEGTKLTNINKIPTIESNLTTTAGQVETNRQNIVTLQNESKVKTINSVAPNASGNFSISAGNNVTITPGTNGIEISASGGGSSGGDWTQWTQGTNWTLNNELFNNSRVAQKDMIICNSAGTNISNLYVALNEYIPKASSFDRAIGWNIVLWGNWTDDKVVTSCYVDTSTSTMYTSLTGTAIKCTLKYRTISAEGTLGAITTTTLNITKSNLIVYYK